MIRLTDELLMAYADGALPDTEAASVASALEHDVEARAIVAEFRRTAERARAAYADIMTEAVPDNLIHCVLGTGMRAANVVDMARARKARPANWRIALPLAASVALLIGVAATLLLRELPTAQMIALGPIEPATPLAELLETKPSGVAVARRGRGADGGEHLMVIATFRDRKARICREIEVLDANMQAKLAGAACRDPSGGAWIVEGVARIAYTLPSHQGNFVPSGTDEKDALEGLLAILGASKALTADEEQRLIAGRWR
jgi:hypothetical protein